jgi:AhpD family alkylhydroperoxidase
MDNQGKEKIRADPSEDKAIKSINYAKLAPDAIHAIRTVELHVRQCGLETRLLELVRLRASQINHCAYCLDMHSKDARARGETEQRLYALSAWRETPFYSERERAALAWTEAVTLISQNHLPDDLHESVRKHFSEKEVVNLTMTVIAINGWNRLAISFRVEPGTYQVPSTEKAH